MPWKEKTVIQTRQEFILEAKAEKKSFSQLCREYGISRKTGYKWLNRYDTGEALEDRSRRPFHIPNKTPEKTEKLILSLRDKHPAWGARKLKRRLEDLGHRNLPATSTISDILKRNNRISPQETLNHQRIKRFEMEQPNDLWQMDFKGHFPMRNASTCFPLTVLDDHSRYSICLEAKENQKGLGVKNSLTRVFQEYGMPKAILSDNGAPFGDNHLSISSMDSWLMQLNILPMHIRPRHPQSQGKEERFHLTMEKELSLRSFLDLEHAQKSFDKWREVYNNQRPHQALDFDVPARHYSPSTRPFPSRLTEPEYQRDSSVVRVDATGFVRIQRQPYYISKSLSGKYLLVDPREDGFQELVYGHFRVAVIDPFEHQVNEVKIRRRKG